MKKKLFLLVFAITIVLSAACLAVCADTVEPKVDTYAYNLVFGNQVYIEYAVKVDGATGASLSDVGVLVWREGTTDRKPETAAADLKALKTVSIEGVDCYVSVYTDISAKEMTDKVFSQPYVKYNGKTYYGKIVEYSICTYAERKLGLVKGVEGTKDENLRSMLREMLDYGANAQKYFGYKTDKLATDLLKNRVNIVYDSMMTVGADGKETSVPNPNPAALELVSGKYKLQAPQKEGYTFKYWADMDNEWEPITEIDTSAEKTYNLAAMWEMNVYSITYKGTMGVNNDNTETYTVEEFVQLRPLEKYDYTFKGWRNTTEVGQWDDIEEIPVGSIGNIVLTAEWEQKPEFKGFSYAVDDNYFLLNGQKFCILLGVDSTNDAKKLEIPDVFNHIQAGALKYCSQLEELTLPYLGSDYTGMSGSYLGYMFGADTALSQNDVIPQTLKKVTVNGSGRIGTNAFRDCTNLVEIVVSGTSSDIGENAYLGCTSLVSLTTPVYYNDAMNYSTDSRYPMYQTDFYYGIPGAVVGKYRKDPSFVEPDIPVGNFETLHINGGEIGRYAFDANCAIKHLIIEGVDVIRERACSRLKNMETLELREGLKQIQNSAFYYCANEKFTELIIPNSVTNLCGCDYDEVNGYEGPITGNSAHADTFRMCNNISKIVIGDGVEVIPAEFIYRNAPKTPLELTLGKNVRVIGHWAFSAEKGFNKYTCYLDKVINNSEQEEMIIYWQGEADGSEFLNALRENNNLPKKIYLGSYEDEEMSGAATNPITETNAITEEQLRSFEDAFKLVLWSAVNPYENGTALEGFDYWHGKDPKNYWIHSQYDEVVLWEKKEA